MRTQVQEGRCILAWDASGRLVQTVPLASIYILRHEDGKLLVQLAKQKVGVSTSHVTLPATKLKEQELPKVAMLRLLRQISEHLEDAVDWQAESCSFSSFLSHSSGIPTTYVNTCFEACSKAGSKTYLSHTGHWVDVAQSRSLGSEGRALVEGGVVYVWMDVADYNRMSGEPKAMDMSSLYKRSNSLISSMLSAQ